MEKSKIRNFSIISHIDHGKSTLADRLLEITGAVHPREMKNQLLDWMDLEKERGITIKLNAVQLKYITKNNKKYIFNLIDTPGHIDFIYEVSRSLSACEGVLLVIDATQGIEAQTLTNLYLALNNNLKIIPIINKIDLKNANIEKTKKEIKKILNISNMNIPTISAKKGINIDQVIKAIIEYIPSPIGKEYLPLQALIFDSYYDQYRGVILWIRIKNGKLMIGDKIKLINFNNIYEVIELGINSPKSVKKQKLVTGEVGWIAANIKNIENINIGETITLVHNPTKECLPKYNKINPTVYCNLYPINTLFFNNLKIALNKMKLSYSGLTYEIVKSKIFGLGFNCGFLGLLHMEIIKERLEREYNLQLIITSPSVIYNIYLINKQKIIINDPNQFPLIQNIKYIEEPYVIIKIVTPFQYIGLLMKLCQNKRGNFQKIKYINNINRILIYEIPFNEIIFDFFNNIKIVSKGEASYSYENINYKISKLVKLDIFLNKIKIDSLSTIVHHNNAFHKAKELCIKLKKNISKHNFEINIQATINNKIIVRENIKPLKKNVLNKCGGGDILRKRKLLEKQKKGKKKMKQFGSITIPHKILIDILKIKI